MVLARDVDKKLQQRQFVYGFWTMPIKRSISWSLFNVKATSNLVKWSIYIWSFMWWCQITWLVKIWDSLQFLAQPWNGLYKGLNFPRLLFFPWDEQRSWTWGWLIWCYSPPVLLGHCTRKCCAIKRALL